MSSEIELNNLEINQEEHKTMEVNEVVNELKSEIVNEVVVKSFAELVAKSL